MKKKWFVFLLCLLLTGCGVKDSTLHALVSVNLMRDIPQADTIYAPLTADASRAITDFSQSLLLNSIPEQENTLLSPLSVLNALAMTANGAANKTLAEMETAFGAPLDTLNQTLSQYQALEQEVFTVCNSIWLRDDDRLNVEDAFLQTNADYYHADVFRTPMDESTVQDINNWISGSTKNRIPELIREIPKGTNLYLVNALTFDGKWLKPYTKEQIRQETFTHDDGTTQSVKLMYDSCGTYLEDAYATGFMKNYKGGRYVFAALRPNDGVTVDQYLDTLQEGSLYELLLHGQNTSVSTAIPKFEVKYETHLDDALQDMGMTDIFDPRTADLSGISSTPLYISTVLHGTYITVDETGTKATAVTAVPAPEAAPAQKKPKIVYLDKPFVYLIWDQIDQIPLFIGVMREIP
ncbi:MAG: serpin family protein [Clostridia bacterium]|nr:serpin family protein [Clostridia bacterium]